MKAYAIEYDFNLVTVKYEVKPPEHKVEYFSNPQEFIARVQHLYKATSVLHEVVGISVNSNIKTYVGDLSEIPLEKALNPFG